MLQQALQSLRHRDRRRVSGNTPTRRLCAARAHRIRLSRRGVCGKSAAHRAEWQTLLSRRQITARPLRSRHHRAAGRERSCRARGLRRGGYPLRDRIERGLPGNRRQRRGAAGATRRRDRALRRARRRAELPRRARIAAARVRRFRRAVPQSRLAARTDRDDLAKRGLRVLDRLILPGSGARHRLRRLDRQRSRPRHARFRRALSRGRRACA